MNGFTAHIKATDFPESNQGLQTQNFYLHNISRDRIRRLLPGRKGSYVSFTILKALKVDFELTVLPTVLQRK